MLRLSEAKDLEPHAIRQAIERAVVESPGWVPWGSGALLKALGSGWLVA